MDVEQTILYLRAKGLTYCGRSGKLETLTRLAAQVEAAKIPGLFLEAGVAMGGSAAVLAKTKSPERELRLYDVFELLPPPSEADGAKAQQVYESFRRGQASSTADMNYLTHARDLLAFTQATFREVGVDPDRDNIQFVRGLYEETLHVDEDVAFAHIDCDWFDSVNLCIARLADRISPRGVMLFDDYHSFEGCRRAVDEWLARDDRFEIVHSGWTLGVSRRA